MGRPDLEGCLWKWTNYWNGWQPRWFVLQDGVLQYYQSKEERGKGGSRGSLRLAACDISVHPHWLELAVPAHCRFYLQPASEEDKHRWLVALGSAKAAASSPSECCDAKYRTQLHEQCYQILNGVEQLRNHSQEEDWAKKLQADCDNFILTVEDCMTAAQAKIPEAGQLLKPGSSSLDSQRPLPEPSTSLQPLPTAEVNSTPPPHNKPLTPQADPCEDESLSEMERELTFFSKMPYSFVHISLADEGLIPTSDFLKASTSTAAIFDILGPTLFSPVKKDMLGNVQKLKKRHETDPKEHVWLQNMVLREVEEGGNNATLALLWLKRGLEFMQYFLQEYLNGCEDLTRCASRAYEQSLQPFHGWVARSLFKVIVKGLPSQATFLNLLGGTKLVLCQDLAQFLDGLSVVTAEINRFYQLHNLEDNTVV